MVPSYIYLLDTVSLMPQRVTYNKQMLQSDGPLNISYYQLKNDVGHYCTTLM